MKENKLRQEFISAACPTIQEFSGIYEVKMLTGFWLPPNVKIISKATGFNRMLGAVEWGHFWLRYGMTQEMERVVEFDYDVPGNKVTSRIRDYVRRLDDGSYLGAFNYVLMGRSRFVGYFSLKQVNSFSMVKKGVLYAL